MRMEPTECSKTLAQKIDADKSPKRKNTTLTAEGKFEKKNNSPLWGGNCTIHSIIKKTPDQEIQN